MICLSANTVNTKPSCKVVVLHGSPHKNSHTEKLTEEYIRDFDNVIHINLFGADILPCNDCKYCHKNDGCFLKDGFENIAKEIDSADLIVLSAPVYFLGFPAPVKAFIDRTQQFFVRRILTKREVLSFNKEGVLITTCGGNDISAIESLKKPAKMFFSVFGAKLKETIYLTDTDKNG